MQHAISSTALDRRRELLEHASSRATIFVRYRTRSGQNACAIGHVVSVNDDVAVVACTARDSATIWISRIDAIEVRQ